MPNFGNPPIQSSLDAAGKVMISDEWANYLNNISSGLQTSFGINYVVIPSLSNADISTLETTGDRSASFVHNSDTDEMMVNKAGVYVNLLTA